MSLDLEQLKRIIEAAILVSDQPLSIEQMQRMFEGQEFQDPPTVKMIQEVIQLISEQYQGKGVELKQVASGYRIQALEELSPWIQRLWSERPPRYSRAFLETLALIAYRQPITRAEIEDIRGVSVSASILKSLLEREWIKNIGHKDVPGKPALYGTTKQFLDDFNLKSLDQLPSLTELQDLDSFDEKLELQLNFSVSEPPVATDYE